MSAVLGGSVGGETAPPAALLDSDVEGIIEEKNQLISRQYAEIERLQRELAEVVGERDALLCEVSKFKFEREMTDLKRLHDDRYVVNVLYVHTFFFFLFSLLFPLALAYSRPPPRPTSRTYTPYSVRGKKNEDWHSGYTCFFYLRDSSRSLSLRASDGFVSI